MKKYITTAKMIGSVVLLLIVLYRLNLVEVISTTMNISFFWLFFGVFLMFFQSFLCAVRWYYILRFIDVEQPFYYCLKIYWIGIFFNTCLPTGVAGDGVRILLLRKNVSDVDSLSSVFLDRLYGLSALFIVICFGAPVLCNLLGFSFISPQLFYSIIALLILSSLLLSKLVFRKGIFIKRSNSSKGYFLEQLISTICLINNSWYKVVFLSALALLGIIFQIFTLYVFSLSLHLNLHLLNCFVLIPPVFLLTMIPISIGGWGVRENAMVFFMGLLGMPDVSALMLSFMCGCATILVSCPGAFIWMKFKNVTNTHHDKVLMTY